MSQNIINRKLAGWAASVLSLNETEGELLLSLSQDYPPPPGEEGDVVHFCDGEYLVSFLHFVNFLAFL